MSKRSSSRTVSSRSATRQLEPMALPALVGLSVGLFTAYIIAEMTLTTGTHPLHWIVAAGGAAAGYVIGLLILLVNPSS